MLATSHALVAGMLAVKITNPVIGLPLAFLTHPIMDAIPHWDTGTGWRTRPRLLTFTNSLIDVVISIALTVWLFSGQVGLPYLFAMIFTAQFGDWLEAPFLFFNWNFPPFSWAYQIQHRIHHRLLFAMGFFTQVATLSLFFLFLQLLPN